MTTSEARKRNEEARANANAEGGMGEHSELAERPGSNPDWDRSYTLSSYSPTTKAEGHVVITEEEFLGNHPSVKVMEMVYAARIKEAFPLLTIGSHGEAPTEEVRVTASSGGQKGSKPARYDLIPTDALELLARHYGKGNAKYPAVNGMDNWRNGYQWSLSYAAMQRHLHSFWAGEDCDEETGSLHLVAAMWHCATLIHFVNHPDMPEEYDDRQDVLDGSRVR